MDQHGSIPLARYLWGLLAQHGILLFIEYSSDFKDPLWEPRFVDAAWVGPYGHREDMQPLERDSWLDAAHNAYRRSGEFASEVRDECEAHCPLRVRWLQLERAKSSGPSNCQPEAMPERDVA